MVYLALDSLPEPGDRYTIGELLGTGVWAKVIIFFLLFQYKINLRMEYNFFG